MDPIVQMVVDILRRKKEDDVLRKGGNTAGVTPAAPTSKLMHAGRTYDDIVTQAERG